MKIIRSKDIPLVPASHEDREDPGAVKKILLRRKDLISGSVQMINWATLLPGKKFQNHHHTDMQEIFIIISGDPIVTINEINSTLHAGDAIVIDSSENHQMTNPGNSPIPYIVVGVSAEAAGKTVNSSL
jgi:mannose-6-phosphate isomerase-like protein (cupin superfamily)